jgi:hypothetical protein
VAGARRLDLGPAFNSVPLHAGMGERCPRGEWPDFIKPLDC